jgi:mannose-6-phosphate isomerase-like protein (cupin superfamily)
LSGSYQNKSWGRYRTLFSRPDCMVKYLHIKPNTGMSFQRHFKRQELWFVQKGKLEIRWSQGLEKEPEKNYSIKILKKFDWWYITSSSWHQIINPTDKEVRVIEVQFGEECAADDIERLSYYD